MPTRKLDKGGWKPFFDRLTKHLEDAEAEIEVMSLALGDQVEAEWLPLYGITYEPREDMLEIALENLDHMIAKPREIYAEEQGDTLVNIEVVDGGGVRQIVRFREKLALAK
jgi:hypothetical protein